MMEISRGVCANILSEALRDWLSGQGRAVEYLPLQQLFALCHAGLVQRETHNPSAQPAVASPTGRQPLPLPLGETVPLPSQARGPAVLGSGLVRLLDGCLTAAAALPEPDLRRRAAGNVLAAFCRSALREARLRGAETAGGAATGSGSSGSGPAGGPECAAAGEHRPVGAAAAAAATVAAAGSYTLSALTSMDTSFLDTAFAVLAALAPRHPLLLSELRVMEVAWGSAAAEAVGAAAAAAAGGGAERAAEGDERRVGAEAGPAAAAAASLWGGPRCVGAGVGGPSTDTASGAAGVDADALADFFLTPEFQCQLAAGQLLFGMPTHEPTPRSAPLSRLPGCGQRAAALHNNGGGSGGCGWSGKAETMDWSRADPHRQAGLGAVDGGGGGGGHAWEEVEEAEDEEEAQLLREADLAGLCEVPALAELCGVAAVSDLWPGLVARVAEGGAEAAARWLGSHVAYAEALEGGWRPAGGLGLMQGGAPGEPSGYGAGLEGTEAGGQGQGAPGEEGDVAPQRAMARRCLQQLAAAMALRPEALLPALPPQLLCVLALRSAEVRRALMSGLAAAAAAAAHTHARSSCSSSSFVGASKCWPGAAPIDDAGGGEVPTDPWVSGAARTQLGPPPLQPLRHPVGQLAEWFRVLGWDLGELLQAHLTNLA